jgi:hypothetical protein
MPALGHLRLGWRRNKSGHVRYAPESDQILAAREMSRCANNRHSLRFALGDPAENGYRGMSLRNRRWQNWQSSMISYRRTTRTSLVTVIILATTNDPGLAF